MVILSSHVPISPPPLLEVGASEQSLRLTYAMALVRFVNGVVDSGQKGQVATSVAMLASAFGLPRILVLPRLSVSPPAHLVLFPKDSHLWLCRPFPPLASTSLTHPSLSP